MLQPIKGHIDDTIHVTKHGPADQRVKLTPRGRHAVMAMVEIAQKAKEGRQDLPVPLSQVASAGGISLSYLEQLFAGLRRAGLVRSFRGPGGGYILARPPEDILIADILLSAEDCAPARRSTNEGPESGNAQTQNLWDHIGAILYASLSHISLGEVCNDQVAQNTTLHKLFESLH